MGTWGIRACENDGAADLLADLESQGTKVLDNAFRAVMREALDGLIEAETGQAAIAAMAVLARIANYTQSIAIEPDLSLVEISLRSRSLTPNRIMLARKAVLLVFSEVSELARLYQESNNSERWKKHTESLLSLLCESESKVTATKSG